MGKSIVLLELRVKDFGIIEDIEWKLDEGLSVITGETGAGKSLVIDAVELLLSGASSDDIIRSGAIEARIEGTFLIQENNRNSSIHGFLTEKGLSQKEEFLIISCEVRKQKPAIVRINGHTVTKTVLRQLGQLLIDIHGQSEHLSLLDKKYHLEFIDAYAHNSDLRNKFSSRISQYNGLTSEIKSLKDKEQAKIRQEEFLRYQIEEIGKAKLLEGEDEELEQERRRISFIEKIKEYSSRIDQSLSGGDRLSSPGSALTRMNDALQALRKLVELDSKLASQIDELEKAIIEVEEIARDARDYCDNLENNPQRLEEIESRLELIRSLKRKYGKTISEILCYQQKSERDLTEFSHSAERCEQLEKDRSSLRREIGQIASALSAERQKAAQRLTINAERELRDLDMSRMKFEVNILQTKSADGINGPDGETYAFNNEGIDDVEFMVSTNPGEPLKPLAKIASTGEISRFTLALKSALSEADNTPVLIFDEVDIGVGGRSGDIIGKKLWALARNHQVICVTHLPQIAVYADAHFGVQKQTVDQRTSSTLKKLEDDAQIIELAIMLAGADYSKTALKNARELLQKADIWKKTN
jgi:DNA repair protein RecN (Recombination protein N)